MNKITKIGLSWSFGLIWNLTYFAEYTAGLVVQVVLECSIFDRAKVDFNRQLFSFYIIDGLMQGWPTAFGSRATLEVNLVYAGNYKYRKGLYILTFEKRWFVTVNLFYKRYTY